MQETLGRYHIPPLCYVCCNPEAAEFGLRQRFQRTTWSLTVRKCAACRRRARSAALGKVLLGVPLTLGLGFLVFQIALGMRWDPPMCVAAGVMTLVVLSWCGFLYRKLAALWLGLIDRRGHSIPPSDWVAYDYVDLSRGAPRFNNPNYRGLFDALNSQGARSKP